MTNHTHKPLRWLPGAILAAALALSFIVPSFTPGIDRALPMLIGVGSALLIMLWWLFLSRARWSERLGVAVLTAVGVAVTRLAVDPSISGGAQGFLGYIVGIQFFALAIAAWASVTARMDDRTRRLALIPMLVLIGAGSMLAIRTEGIKNSGFVYHWRWTPTPEELLLVRGDDEPKPLPAAMPEVPAVPAGPIAVPPAAVPAPVTPALNASPVSIVPVAPERVAEVIAPAEWPGFRGPNRDSVVHIKPINTDWNTTPPTEMWRRPVGPGWSSFSVRGDLLYTQEQRGDDEIVAAYRVSTGEPVWRHRDPIRFYESNGGAGPRGTPTIHGNRVYAMGATGFLNALDANTGKVAWSHDVAKDTGREIPMWGISSSPLIVDDVVIVSLYGTLAGYEVATGTLRWVGPKHGGSYSSPHLLIVDGVTQVVILSAPGAVSVNPSDGKLLWEHKWEGGAIVQPAVTAEGDILINAMGGTGGIGTRRLVIRETDGGWTAEERWTTNGLKPYFNDLVIHKGYAFGFDGNILSCIDLADGKRKWKGGRYGNGQMLLLADQDVLLVLSEEGELALVSATPDQFKEIARIPALNAKTWNHP
ncbi:MAG TPA: PQQ-binding-like beta-propeller repeat protein, partial [Vicinamibacterales bacterium]